MSSTSSDLTLLGGRLRVMTIARIVLVGALLAALAPVYRYALDGTSLLVTASLAYLVLNGVALLVLRRTSGPTRWLLDLSLVFDAAWVGAILYVTGGTTSGFIFLLYLQLVAATVLFSWRSGVKLAILHTIAILGVFYGQVVGFATEAAQSQVTFGFFNIRLDPALGESGRIASQVVRVQAILSVVTVWIITGATAFFSNVNERALRRSNQELALLRELSVQLESTLDLGEICEAIANGVVEELRHDRSVVWMAQGGSELVPAGAAGFEDDELDRLAELRLVVGPGPLQRAVETRRPVLVAREHARPAALADAFEIDSPLIIVPLQTEGRILGLLTVEVAAALGRAPRVKGRDLRILSTLATESSLALDNARLHAELRDLSITDALTGVYNHRHFQQRLQEELDRSARLSTLRMPRPVSLILMDVDHFKKINDRFGHPAGDDLLRALARLVERVLRSSDVVCRYGGEEFAIVLPETSAEAARQVAERLRSAIELSSFAASDGRYLGQVTASFGIASFERGVPNRGDLIREADGALYAAKSGGRNLALHADDPHEPSASTDGDAGELEPFEPTGTRPSG